MQRFISTLQCTALLVDKRPILYVQSGFLLELYNIQLNIIKIM